MPRSWNPHLREFPLEIFFRRLLSAKQERKRRLGSTRCRFLGRVTSAISRATPAPPASVVGVSLPLSEPEVAVGPERELADSFCPSTRGDGKTVR